jgi:hypothetical protein
MLVFIGMITIWASFIWVLIDVFLIPGMTQQYNLNLAARMAPATNP